MQGISMLLRMRPLEDRWFATVLRLLKGYLEAQRSITLRMHKVTSRSQGAGMSQLKGIRLYLGGNTTCKECTPGYYCIEGSSAPKMSARLQVSRQMAGKVRVEVESRVKKSSCDEVEVGGASRPRASSQRGDSGSVVNKTAYTKHITPPETAIPRHRRRSPNTYITAIPDTAKTYVSQNAISEESLG